MSEAMKFGIFKIELFLELPLELILHVDGIGSTLDFFIPTMSPHKGIILRKYEIISHLLTVLLTAHFHEIGLESPYEVVDFSCTPSPITYHSRSFLCC